MPELRQDMATKEWVLIASERAKRPHEFCREPQRPLTHTYPPHVEDCPFCPGNESRTPETIERIPRTGPWQVRLFGNKFPALNPKGARVVCLDGICRKINGVGFHEVLIESPLHNTNLAYRSVDQIALMLRCFRDRGRVLISDERVEHVIYFKNHGPEAGSSIEHPHCQLAALPMVPYAQRRRIEELRRAYDDDGCCPYCRMIELELHEQARVVGHNEHFVAIIPYAASSPFYMKLLPRRHSPTFLDQSGEELTALAAMLRDLMGKLYVGLNDPAYNFLIQSAPFRDSSSAYLHWYLSIIPRVTKAAGFELGTGMFINPSLPEESARFLREQETSSLAGMMEQAGVAG